MVDRKSAPSWRRRISPLITAALGLFVVVSVISAAPVSEDRSHRIGKQVRCPACEGESIAESPSSYASDMMTYVRDLIDQGLSDDQILDRLMASYPESQVLDPPLRAGTLLLWVIPAAALITGIGMTVSRLRRRAPEPAEGEPP